MMKNWIRLVIFMFNLGVSGSVLAIAENAGNLINGQEAQGFSVDGQVQNSNVIWQNNSFLKASSGKEAFSVFGEQVFSGGFSGIRADGMNQAYKIMPGDRVIVRLWGSVDIERVLPVDSQGNIFIPSIGPVFVQGLTQSELTPKVTSAIKLIYTKGVNVYTQLQGIQPISVYVTGFVNSPGRYAGTPTDSIIYFLNQANGINHTLGSYRNIKIIRDGKMVERFDIYQFLTQGVLPKVQLEDGDTILIEKRGVMVSVALKDKPAVQYELLGMEQHGDSLFQYIVLPAGISHALVSGYELTGPDSEYLALQAFRQQIMRDGDHIVFTQDQRKDTILVQVEGSYIGQSSFIVPIHTRLVDLLANIEVEADLTATRDVSIRRQSIAKQQKQSLISSLSRLEQTYMTASSSTPEEAAIRVKEAELIMGFVQRAKNVEPNGRLVVANGESVTDVRLQDGDVITLPSNSDSVMISGQVLVPTSLVYQESWSLQAYIDKSGGFTDQADEDRIVVIRQSGEVVADKGVKVKPGDEILVLPEVPTKNIQLATSMTQILYQIAIAAKVALNL